MSMNDEDSPYHVVNVAVEKIEISPGSTGTGTSN